MKNLITLIDIAQSTTNIFYEHFCLANSFRRLHRSFKGLKDNQNAGRNE